MKILKEDNGNMSSMRAYLMLSGVAFLMVTTAICYYIVKQSGMETPNLDFSGIAIVLGALGISSIPSLASKVMQKKDEQKLIPQETNKK